MLATERSRSCFRLMILVLFSLSLSSVILINAKGEAGYLFYIYGSSFCPACRFAKETLSSVYGASAVIFRDIYVTRSYMEVYLKLYSLFELGNESYIPLIVVYDDDILEAVVVGATPTEEQNVTRGWSDFLKMASSEKEVLVSVGGVMKKVGYAKVANEVYDMVLKEEDRRALALSFLQMFYLFSSEVNFTERYYTEDVIFNYSGVSYSLPDIPEVVKDIRDIWKDPYIRFKELRIKRENGLLWVNGLIELFTQDGVRGEGTFRVGFTRVENDFRIARESLEVHVLEA